METRAVAVACDILTPYGMGIDACWEGLASNRTAITRVSRFSTEAFVSGYAGIVSGLEYRGKTSLVMQMLGRLLAERDAEIPGDARLLLATIKGEIEFLEKSILDGRGNAAGSAPGRLLEKVVELTGASGGAMVISAACTSASAAVARAVAMIRSGRADCALVVACDAVTEFIFSGFSSLMALDRVPARPFDRNRGGLNVGEAAAWLLLMSEERAAREGRVALAEVAGWGLSDDANHMTGPSRESEGMIAAIRAALRSAGVSPDRIGFVSAHGTGTPYNDAMEMRAFRAVLPEPVPVYSIKGGIGHTMGAAGLVEFAIACRALRERRVPPTVNLTEVDDDARGWVSERPRFINGADYGLLVNAGFSGINAALVVKSRGPS